MILMFAIGRALEILVSLLVIGECLSKHLKPGNAMIRNASMTRMVSVKKNQLTAKTKMKKKSQK